MSGIFADPSSGGAVVRHVDGTPVVPVSGEPPNVYRPDAAFIMSCEQTAAPVASCPQPPSPAQMNAITSQLLALAECWSPTGPYDCDDPQVLCEMFSSWVANVLPGLTGASFTDCAGNLHGTAATIPSCAEMALAIATAVDAVPVHNDCAGVPHPDGAQVPSCVEMTAAIAAVTIGATLPAAPATNVNAAIPTTYYGNNTERLGGPVRWIELTIPGVAGVVTIPSYT